MSLSELMRLAPLRVVHSKYKLNKHEDLVERKNKKKKKLPS